jgi:cytochrome c553
MIRHLAALTAMLTACLAATSSAAADRQAGEQLASAGNGQGAMPCVTCHGSPSSAPQPTFPSLAGQPAEYLYKQLADYASGARQNPIMQPIATGLSDGDRQNVAEYYGSLPLAFAAAASAASSELGRTLATTGSQGKPIQACANCHGPEGAGEPPLNPRLAGQSTDYTRAQLDAFHKGERTNDVAGVMREIAGQLSDQEVEALAVFFGSLGAPQTSGQRP